MSSYKPPKTLFRSVKDIIKEEAARIENLCLRQGELERETSVGRTTADNTKNFLISGIPTGFIDIDKTTEGLPYGVSAVGARPEEGLTDFGLNIALNASETHRVVYLSQTIDASLLVRRMIHMRAGICFSSANNGFIAERDFSKIAGALGTLSTREKDGRLSVSNYPLDFCNFNEQCRQMKEERGIQLLVVDRFQSLFPKENANGESGYWKAREIADILHETVAEQGIALLLLSEMKKRTRHSTLSTNELRDWGVLEYSASPIILFETERNYRNEEEWPTSKEVEIKALITNNLRGNITDTVNLIYLKKFGKFESVVKVVGYDED